MTKIYGVKPTDFNGRFLGTSRTDDGRIVSVLTKRGDTLLYYRPDGTLIETVSKGDGRAAQLKLEHVYPARGRMC